MSHVAYDKLIDWQIDHSCFHIHSTRRESAVDGIWLSFVEDITKTISMCFVDHIVDYENVLLNYKSSTPLVVCQNIRIF